MSTINNTTKNTVVSGTSGADSITNSADYVTIDAGAGDDFIYSVDSNVSIRSGEGNDTISLVGSYGNVTVSGGTGNDSIYNGTDSREGGRYYQYFHGDGNDTIWNYSSDDTISIGSYCYYSTVVSGSNIVVSVAGSGSITLKDAIGKKVNVITYPHNTAPVNPGKSTFIYNYTPSATVNGTSNADTILNHAGGAKVSAGSGNDAITHSALYNYSPTLPVTLDGGYGDDTIRLNYADNSYINGNYGNDRIYVYKGDGNTIRGGSGNDVISLASSTDNLIQYFSGDGIDTIYGYNYSDTIVIGAVP